MIKNVHGDIIATENNGIPSGSGGITKPAITGDATDNKFRDNGGSCQVTCLQSSCQVRTGGTMGSCFLPPFPTKCSGLPSGCGSCVNECSKNQGGSSSSNSFSKHDRKNSGGGGNAKCQTTCESNGSCIVKIINGPPGALSGSCFPP